jgi:hypothetical protein
LFESGCLLRSERYIEAAARTAEALLARQRSDGWLAGTYRLGWLATSRSCCLTGNCQASRLWLRLFELRGNAAYLDGARRAILFVSQTQNMRASNPGIRGGIAGSEPIFGNYEPFKYPNWAAKFYVDALLTWNAVKKSGHLPYAG